MRTELGFDVERSAPRRASCRGACLSGRGRRLPCSTPRCACWLGSLTLRGSHILRLRRILLLRLRRVLRLLGSRVLRLLRRVLRLLRLRRVLLRRLWRVLLRLRRLGGSRLNRRLRMRSSGLHHVRASPCGSLPRWWLHGLSRRVNGLSGGRHARLHVRHWRGLLQLSGSRRDHALRELVYQRQRARDRLERLLNGGDVGRIGLQHA